MAPRSGKPRDPAREGSWRRTMAEQARSGLSISASCRRQGLKPWTFRWWWRELAHSEQLDERRPLAHSDRAVERVLNRRVWRHPHRVQDRRVEVLGGHGAVLDVGPGLVAG